MGAASYSQFIGRLSESDQIYFYEVLAHNLTVATRGIWSDSKTTPEEKIEGMKKINEVLHRVTSKISVQRLKTHEWKEEDIWGILSHIPSDRADTQNQILSAVRMTMQTLGNENRT